jgi:DNA-binding CsgD family transcriptional regulator
MAESDLTDRQRQALILLRANHRKSEAARIMGVSRARMTEFCQLIEKAGVEVPEYVPPPKPEPEPPAPRPRKMTDRDRQVLKSIRTGRKQVETAEKLGIGKARVGQIVKRLRTVYGQDI